MSEEHHIKSAAEMEIWVQAHGYPRFCQAMANGEFKGGSLRVARQWDIDRSERRKRRLVLALVFLVIAAALAVVMIYVAPVLLKAARH